MLQLTVWFFISNALTKTPWLENLKSTWISSITRRYAAISMSICVNCFFNGTRYWLQLAQLSVFLIWSQTSVYHVISFVPTFRGWEIANKPCVLAEYYDAFVKVVLVWATRLRMHQGTSPLYHSYHTPGYIIFPLHQALWWSHTLRALLISSRKHCLRFADTSWSLFHTKISCVGSFKLHSCGRMQTL